MSSFAASALSPGRRDVEGGGGGGGDDDDGAYAADGESLMQGFEGLLMRWGLLGKGAGAAQRTIKRAMNPAKVV